MKRQMMVIVLAGFVLAFVAHAQNAPLAFLTSKAALRAYAVDQAVVASANLYSPSQVRNQTTGWGMILQTNHSSADILAAYTSQTFRITVLNPNDQVYLNASVNNADGYQLFYGGSWGQPVLGKGGYSLSPISLVLKLAGNIPVKFSKPVANAEMLYVNPTTGQTYNRQQVQSYGNMIFFPSDSAGDGFLTVNFTDGSQSNYDLRPANGGGSKTDGDSISQQVGSANIENLLSYVNPWQIVDQIPSQNGIGENRTYEVTMNDKAPWPNKVAFSVSTTEGYYPRGVWMRPKGGDAWTYIPWLSGQIYTLLPFAIGTWYLIPDWDPAQLREPDPNIYNGGGLG